MSKRIVIQRPINMAGVGFYIFDDRVDGPLHQAKRVEFEWEEVEPYAGYFNPTFIIDRMDANDFLMSMADELSHLNVFGDQVRERDSIIAAKDMNLNDLRSVLRSLKRFERE